MLSPYGLDIVETCSGCKVRPGRIFCDFLRRSTASIRDNQISDHLDQGRSAVCGRAGTTRHFRAVQRKSEALYLCPACKDA
jgi:hypothetical protein